MPNYKNLFVVLALGILASCATTKVTERRINSAESEVIQKTLIADVKVDLTKKITGNSVLEGDDEELAKDMANWNALQFSDAHLVIDPIYKITLSGGTISCTVTAFSGYYDNIKVATQQDLLNNIQVKQLGEIGIAGVSFEEYKYYYNNLNVEVEEGEKLNDEELEEYYYEQLELEYESKKERDKEEIGGEKKHPRAKKALKVTGIVVLAYGVTAGIVNLILYFY